MRYRFPGRTLVTVLGVLPLVIPPFVGAVAFQQILGRSGAVNLLLREHAGFTIPFMEGLTGVVLVQSLHYFPFIAMARVTYVHHYYPALYFAILTLGFLVDWTTRPLWRKISLATISLPVPFSPLIRTVASVRATRPTK